MDPRLEAILSSIDFDNFNPEDYYLKDSTYKSAIAPRLGYIDKYEDRYNTAETEEEKASALAKIDEIKEEIANALLSSEDTIARDTQSALNNIVGYLDTIDKTQAKIDAYAAQRPGQTDKIAKYAASRGKTISSMRKLINEEYADLAQEVARFGAVVPDELKDIANVRDIYNASQEGGIESYLDYYGDQMLSSADRIAAYEAEKAKAEAASLELDRISSQPQVMPEVPIGEFVEPTMGERLIYGYTGQDQLTRDEAIQAANAAFNRTGVKPDNIDDASFNSVVDYYQKVGTEIGDSQFNNVIAPQILNAEGPGGLSILEATEIAKQIPVYSDIRNIINPETGKAVDDPVQYLTGLIYGSGYEPALEYMKESGISFRVPVQDNMVDPGVAEEFAAAMLQGGNYSLANIRNWTNIVQNKGFEEALKEFNAVGNTTNITAASIPVYAEKNAPLIDALKGSAEDRLNENIGRILSGEKLSPAVPQGLTSEQAFEQAVSLYPNIQYSDKEKRDWVNYFNEYGIDAGLMEFNVVNNLFDQPGKDAYLTAPIQKFEPTGVYRPDLPSASTQGQYTTSGIYQAPSFTPAAQAPTTGLPAITSAFPTTYQPAPYTPPALIDAAPGRPTLTPAQEVIGAPEIGRPVGAPMQALTAQEAGSQFVPPTQEDYYAFFGYTPEQLNAAQYLAELEGAPRAGIAAQTVPVLPPAVTGAPAPTGMKEGGAVQNSGLMAAAQELSSKGRNGDKMLVHMTVDEVNDLQNYAQQLGGSLTINPYTGLPEANFFKRVARGLKKIAVPLVAAIAAPYLPAIAGSTALTAGLLAGAGTMIGGGDLGQGLKTGLMAGLGASAAQSMGYQGIPGVQTPAQAAGAAGTGGSAMGAGVSLTPSPGDLDYISSVDKSLLGRTTDYLANIPSAVGDKLSNMDLGDAAMLGYVGMGAMGLKENQQAQREYEQYLANQAAERERRKRAGTEAFERAFAAEGGLVNFAGGGMTYAEGGGTTGATNEPRMVKGTGDGMSDSVPATIEGVQEARLANDEFVIPADVVADLGNGSSSAGAQQLYDMMDRVRQARHGTTEQPPEIDVRKIMPA